MKAKFNSKFQITKFIAAVVSMSFILTLVSCNDDEPVKEDTPELITTVTLTFSPAGGGTQVVATAVDPDGEGIEDIATDGPVNLTANTSYTLSIELVNELADPNEAEYNITEEVKEEGDEHMFFFSWTNDVFSNPAGNGNIDNRTDGMNYEDEDANGLPLGIETSWTTATPSSGKFRVVLKHQPELKTATSTFAIGETDLDIEFDINVQ